MSDELPAFRFLVVLDPTDIYLPREFLALALEAAPASFQEVKGLGADLEVLAYPEGGANDFAHQLPVRHSWGHITLQRGIVRQPALWEWYAAGLHGALGARRDGAVVLLTNDGLPGMMWSFRAGIAAKWSGPEFNAMQNAVAIESLEIAHQGLLQVPGLAVANF